MKHQELARFQQLIQDGEIALALEELVDYCRKKNRNNLDEVLLLTAQWKQYQKDKSLGVAENNTATPNRITQAILEVIRKLETVDTKNSALYVSPWPKRQMYWALLSILSVVFVSLLLWFRGCVHINTTHGAQSPIIENGKDIKIEYRNNTDTNATHTSQ